MKKFYFLLIPVFCLSLLSKAQPGPGICMVTVDDSSKHNLIYYDKSQFSVADSFILWRETNTAGTYARVLANHKTDSSMFIDMDTAGDPNIKLHRYKMQIWDQVGGYSQLGPYHTVLYCLQNGTNYNWNLYDIEGVGGGMVTWYYLLRDDNGLNQWQKIDSMTNSTMSAVDPVAMSFPNGLWRLVTKWSISCSTSARYDGNDATQATIVKTKSNITNNKVAGINNSIKASWVNWYPNPATDKLTLRLNFPVAGNSSVKLYNALGVEVFSSSLLSGKDEMNIPVNDLAKGIYMAELVNGTQKITRRVSIQ